MRAAGDFLAWVAARGVASLGQVQPLHVAAWIEALGGELAAPSVKQQLAGKADMALVSAAVKRALAG